MPCAMYPDTLKYFVKVIGKKAIGHVTGVEAISLNVHLSFGAQSLEHDAGMHCHCDSKVKSFGMLLGRPKVALLEIINLIE